MTTIILSRDDVFWDRLADMPDIEAVEEIALRQDDLALQNAVLEGARGDAADEAERRDINCAIIINNAAQSRLKNEKRLRSIRMDRLSWSNAVKAVYGDDGYLKCREWMEITA